MSCDFKPGDEVVCVDDGQWGQYAFVMGFQVGLRPHNNGPAKGWTGTVTGVEFEEADGLAYISFDQWPNEWWEADAFRKVQRRDLGEWLKTDVGNTDHIDRSVRERVGA